jgi:hypothetical protein
MKALYRVSDGYIFNTCVSAEFTPKETARIESVEWAVYEYDEGSEEAEHIIKRHCFMFDGSLEILPPEEWPENQHPEVEE